MRRAGAAWCVAIVGLTLLAASTSRASAARAPLPITMSGEQVTQALVADLVYFYRHAARKPGTFILTGGGTSAGIADAARGVTDAALVSRALQPDDPRGLVLTPLAISGVCLVANRSNPVPNLTHDQLQDIVAGRVSSWSQIPGSRRADALAPVALPITMGAARVFEDVFIDDTTDQGWMPTTVLTGAQQRDFIEATPAGFGYVDLALSGPLHVIPYENVPCTARTVANGTYPARRPLGIATKGRARGELRRFLRWATTSTVARRVIATRYVPAG